MEGDGGIAHTATERDPGPAGEPGCDWVPADGSQTLLVPGGKKDRDAGQRPADFLLRGPLAWGACTWPSPFLPFSPGHNHSPPVVPTGPRNVYVAVLFFCFPSEDPWEGFRRAGEVRRAGGGMGLAGTPGNLPLLPAWASSSPSGGPGVEAWPLSPPLTLQEPAGSWAHLSRPFTGKRNHRSWLRWPRSLFSLNPRKEKWPRLYILTEKTVCR